MAASLKKEVCEFDSRYKTAFFLTLTVVGFYLLLIYNKYLPVQEGWFSEYGALMNSGKLPYKDFYFFTQPISLLIAQLITSLSHKMIWFRVYGLIERLLMTAVLFCLLSGFFSPIACLAGTISTLVFFSCYLSDAFFTYLCTCLLFYLLALWFIQKGGRHAWQSRYLYLAGIMGSLSFFSKQSNGLFTTLGLGFILVLTTDQKNQCFKNLMSFGIGWILGAIPFLVWIISKGFLRSYIADVFFGAVASKGSILHVLFGFYARLFDPICLYALFYFIVPFSWLIYRRKISFTAISYPNSRLLIYFSASMYIIAVAVPLIFLEEIYNPYVYIGGSLSKLCLISLSTYALTIAFIAILISRFSSRWKILCDQNLNLIILVLGSWFWIYATGLSYMVEDQSMLPGFAVITAFSCDRFRMGASYNGRLIVLFLTFLIVCSFASQKYAKAYFWVGWLDRTLHTDQASVIKELKGYELDPEACKIYDDIIYKIRANVGENELVYTFPFMPMFNYLTDHPQPTFAPVHYWDVCPDNIAIEDAKLLAKMRPKLIINMVMPEKIWKTNEDAFRGGHRSGQREIQRVIDQLSQSSDYKLIGSYKTLVYEYPICVWLRDDSKFNTSDKKK